MDACWYTGVHPTARDHYLQIPKHCSMVFQHYRAKFFLLTLLTCGSSTTRAQVIDATFDGAGDETYTGTNGFGSFNWVNAINFGFPSQQGGTAFLSNYTGFPIVDIGMIKPFNATMQNTTYRVSFYCSRYSSTLTLGIDDYDTLYIGSRHGTMVWDTVPTPANDYQWVRWSGVYTPAPEDIGEPFNFGFSLTLNSGTSFALDGPINATDLSTGITHTLDAPEVLVLAPGPGGVGMEVRASAPMADVDVFDGRGVRVAGAAGLHSTRWTSGIPMLAPGCYVVRARMADGSVRTRRAMSF